MYSEHLLAALGEGGGAGYPKGRGAGVFSFNCGVLARKVRGNERMQAFQQGGTFIFDGEDCVWQRYDKATGDHVDPRDLLDVALHFRP